MSIFALVISLIALKYGKLNEKKYKDIDSVKTRVVWTQTTQFVNTIDDAEGISAWSRSLSAARLCEGVLGDESNITADQWMKNDRKKTLLEA